MRESRYEKFISTSAKSPILKAESSQEFQNKFDLDFLKLKLANKWCDLERLFIQKTMLKNSENRKKAGSISEYHFNCSSLFLID